jgi:ribonucleotide reductase alpha subunit
MFAVPQDHAGVIHSSNLCTEITLNTGEDETAVCNLGSVVLDSHLTPEGEIDHEKLRDTIRIAIRALDNVIDVNFYPTKAAKTSNNRHRPIGLGVMGLQNALFIKDVPFTSEAAVEFNDEFMEAICYYAYEASSDLPMSVAHTPLIVDPSGTVAFFHRIPSRCLKKSAVKKWRFPRVPKWTGPWCAKNCQAWHA